MEPRKKPDVPKTGIPSKSLTNEEVVQTFKDIFLVPSGNKLTTPSSYTKPPSMNYAKKNIEELHNVHTVEYVQKGDVRKLNPNRPIKN
jgi:hypothetical protein